MSPRGPPINPVPPSQDSAMVQPKSPSPISPLPVISPPSWVQVEPERVNATAWPANCPGSGGSTAPKAPPSKTVLPSADSAPPRTGYGLLQLLHTRGALWVQVDPERVNTRVGEASR